MFNEKGNYQYPGDMVKSTYDSNNDGVVNAADSVPWSGVTNTPDTLSGYGIEDVPASVLSGVIGAEHIPPSAVERIKIVENDSMRFALTTADVQNGNTVKVISTDKMYLVVDDGNLDSESGYMVYVAGRAAAVDWTGVENKPETIENIDDILDTSEEESEEGNPITIVTDSAQIAKNTHLTFEPIQDGSGDPSPTNIRSIRGLDEVEMKRTGKNLLKITASSQTYDGVTFTANEDGTVKVNGTATSETSARIAQLQLKAGSYIYTSGVVESFATYDSFVTMDGVGTIARGNNSTSPGNSFTLSEDSVVQIRCRTRSGVAVSDLTFYPMIRLASDTDSTFVPYQEQIVETPLPETVYGGTLDLETGELVVDKVLWSANTSTMNNSEAYPGWVNSGIANIVGYGKNVTYFNVIGNIGNAISANTTNLYGTGTAYLPTNIYGKTQDEWKALALDVQFVIELATPVTYILTPKQLSLLKGTNHISTNAKSVKVTFRNGKLALISDIAEVEGFASAETDRKLEPILGDFASIETSPASENHAVGDYLIYESKLYKVIAAITAGESLAEGTNIGRTTVAAELVSVKNDLTARYEKHIILSSQFADFSIPIGQIWVIIINWSSYANMYNVENWSGGIYIKNMIIDSHITNIAVTGITEGCRVTNNEISQCTAVAFRIV